MVPFIQWNPTRAGSWPRVVDYATLSYPAAYTTSFFVVMNKAKWEALPADIQKIITEINQEWIAKSGQAWDDADQAGWVFMKEKGVELIKLDEAESQRWAEAVRPILDDYVSKTEAKGLPGAEALKTAQEAVGKFSQAQ